MSRVLINFLLLCGFWAANANVLRIRKFDLAVETVIGSKHQLDIVPDDGQDNAALSSSTHRAKNTTSAPRLNNSSGDNVTWDHGGLSDTSSSSNQKSDLGPGNNTSLDVSDGGTRQIGTSAFLFVSIPLIALAAAIASKYGKTTNETVSRIPNDLGDNYSTHRMITAASEEEEEGDTSPDPDHRGIEDKDMIGLDHIISTSVPDRKLFVQVYKPQRDQGELIAIKNGLAMALNDRGSPSIRGSGRYNLAGRGSYTPDDDSEHNSPFDEPSMPI